MHFFYQTYFYCLISSFAVIWNIFEPGNNESEKLNSNAKWVVKFKLLWQHIVNVNMSYVKSNLMARIPKYINVIL